MLTRLARPCGDLRFASRSSYSGLRHLLLPFGERACRAAGKGCHPGGLETCGSSGASCATGGLDGGGGLAGGPRSRCGKKSSPKGQSVSFPSMAQDVLRAVEAGGEVRQCAETPGAALGRGRGGQAQSADCVGMDALVEGSERRCLAGEAALDGGSGGFHGALGLRCVSWWAARSAPSARLCANAW